MPINDNTTPVSFIPCDRHLVAEMAVDLYALDSVETQILAPLRNGPAGTKLLNQLCQERFTAGGTPVTLWNEGSESLQRCGLNLGDVVLCTRNLWDKGLQNGSLGRIVELGLEAGRASNDPLGALAWVEWDDGVNRALTADMLEDIELGYGITVHKAQGSQWRRIVIPVIESRLLDRTLLYTAITRAQAQVILVGDVEAARRATLGPPKAHGRQVGLDLTLQRCLRAAGAYD